MVGLENFIIWPVAVAVFLFGLILGSFATALAWRVPQGLSVSVEIREGSKKAVRSICPHCRHKLGVFDLIPLFSWLLAKGHCRHCKVKISPVYPLMELFTGCAAVGLFLSWGISLQTLLLIALLPFLMAMIVIDFKHMILPDRLNIICMLFAFAHIGVFFVANHYDIRVLVHFVTAGMFFAVFSFVLAFLMTKILRKDAMGMGDVKFFFVAGLFLGFPYFPSFLIFSGVFGVFLGLIWQKLSGQRVFPFGPALILSLYVCLLFQGLGMLPFVGL